MPRRKRTYQPGAAFHITARTNGKEHWLDERIRDELIEILATAMSRCDARLIAYALMSNHFHLVLWQGVMTLGQVMHPIMRKLALRIKRKLGRGGRFMERRFFDVQCLDADHLREAIVYTHLNPLRAGMCARSSDYLWTSQAAYAGGLMFGSVPLQVELDLFAAGELRSLQSLRADYMHFESWREQCWRTPEGEIKPSKPSVRAGDEYWAKTIGEKSSATVNSRPLSQPDLRDLIHWTVEKLAPGMDVDLVYGRKGGRQHVEVRHAAVERAVRAGYSVTRIARHMRISETTVSRIACTTIGRPPVLFR